MFRPAAIRSSSSLTLLFLTLLCVNATTSAQGGAGVDTTGSGGRHAIQGNIYFPSGVRADSRLKIRLESTRYSELSVLADANGTFGFRSLLPGSYTVVVEGGDAYETVRETVYIEGEGGQPRIGIALPTVPRSYRVQIYLQPKRTIENSAKPGVINAALAAVPETARKAFERGMAAAETGDSKKAIEQLKLAVAYYPAFPIALNELGVQYLKAGDVDAALSALQNAVKLAPDAFGSRLNYGIALLQKKNFSDAKLQLEQALRRNPNSATAHLYMGISLIHESRYTDAEKSFQEALRIGKQSVGLAHYYLGGLYWRRGDFKLAADELELYVQETPNAQDAEKVKATIKELRTKIASPSVSNK